MKLIPVLILVALANTLPEHYCECATIPARPGEKHEISELKNAFETSDVVFFGNVLKLNDQYMEEWESVNYLVFAYRGKEGKLYTSICSPNRRIQSEKELAEIMSYLDN